MAKGVLPKPGKAAKTVIKQAADAVPAPSPNPMTNLIIADLALRGGGQLLRHAVERTLLGAKYSRTDAKNLVKGRSMAQTLIGTAVVRLAMRSVPGAIVVGGSLLAKTLYDRRRSKAAASEGRKAIAKQAEKGADEG
ncbi:MAG: hypothetical protein WBL74_05655 [Novosphingobium sp.]|uniref:hypothetical protein n=1 Tax=Novosphingobium sp. TaxID=1874826 RepID=UPI003C7AA43F